MWSVWPLFFISIRISFDQSHCQNIHSQSQNHCFKECTTFRQKNLAQNVRCFESLGGWQNSFWTCSILALKGLIFSRWEKQKKRKSSTLNAELIIGLDANRSGFRICRSPFISPRFFTYLSQVLQRQKSIDISLITRTWVRCDMWNYWNLWNNKRDVDIWTSLLVIWILSRIELDTVCFCLLPVLVGNNSVYMDDVDV